MMSILESDTYSVFHKTHIGEKHLFQTSVVWKFLYLTKNPRTDYRKVISPCFRTAHNIFDLEIFAPLVSKPEDTRIFLYLKRILPSFKDCRLYFKLVIFDAEQMKLYDEHGFESFVRHRSLYEMKLENISNLLVTKSEKQYVTLFLDVVIDEERSPKISLEKKIEILKDDISSVLQHHDLGSLSKDFEDLFKEPQFADITLKVGMDEFPAHKVVLGTRSKVFQKMFTHDLKETQQNVVCIDEMDPQTFKDLLRYIYCGKVRRLSPEEALSLYYAADRYEVMELMTICRKLIANGISVHNACDIAEVVLLHKDPVLIENLKHFLSQNVKEFIKSEDWKTFSINKQDIAVKMLELAISSPTK